MVSQSISICKLGGSCGQDSWPEFWVWREHFSLAFDWAIGICSIWVLRISVRVDSVNNIREFAKIPGATATFGHFYARDYFVREILRAASALITAIRLFWSCLSDGSGQRWLHSSIWKMDYNTVAAFNSILWAYFNCSKIETTCFIKFEERKLKINWMGNILKNLLKFQCYSILRVLLRYAERDHDKCDIIGYCRIEHQLSPFFTRHQQHGVLFASSHMAAPLRLSNSNEERGTGRGGWKG